MSNLNIAIPKWFELESYKAYESLNSKQLCEELMQRAEQMFQLKAFKIYEGWSNLDREEFINLPLFHMTRKSISKRTEEEQLRVDSSVYRNFFLGGPNAEAAVSTLNFNDLDDYLLPKDILKYNFLQQIEPLKDYFYDHIFDDDIDDHENDVLLNSYIKSKLESMKNNARNIILSEYIKNNKNNFSDIIRLFKFTSPLYKRSAEEINLLISQIYKDTPFEKSLPARHYNLEDYTFLKINIAAPEDVIVSELLNHLKSLRESRNITKLNSSINIKEMDKRGGGANLVIKLIEKRIIQYIDLKIWAKCYGYSPTIGWYKNVIFDDKINIQNLKMADTKFTDTIIKHANKWLNRDWIKSFYHFNIPSYKNLKKT